MVIRLSNGIITALSLALITWLTSSVQFLADIEWLQVAIAPRFWPLVLVALVFGLINGMLVPMIMRLFKRAHGAIYFVIVLIVDAGSLMLTAWIAPNSLYIGNWWTALVLAVVLALISTFIFGRERVPRRR